MASLQFTRLSLTLTGRGVLRVYTAVMDPLDFWLISLALVFARSRTSDRSHLRSSMASAVQSPFV
jgi:hypothetical protein